MRCEWAEYTICEELSASAHICEADKKTRHDVVINWDVSKLLFHDIFYILPYSCFSCWLWRTRTLTTPTKLIPLTKGVWYWNDWHQSEEYKVGYEPQLVTCGIRRDHRGVRSAWSWSQWKVSIHGGGLDRHVCCNFLDHNDFFHARDHSINEMNHACMMEAVNSPTYPTIHMSKLWWDLQCTPSFFSRRGDIGCFDMCAIRCPIPEKVAAVITLVTNGALCNHQ